MGMKETFKVLPKHIKAGEPGQVDSCPIALCMKDAGYADISVDQTSIVGVKYGVRWRAATPDNAQTFIDKFDDDESTRKPAPIVVKVELAPDEIVAD